MSRIQNLPQIPAVRVSDDDLIEVLDPQQGISYSMPLVQLRSAVGGGGGTLPDPLLANIIPRQNTLAALTSIVNGNGEIAVATDEDSIVVLKNTGPVDFGRIPVSAIPPTLFPATDTGLGALTNLRVNSAVINQLRSFAGTPFTLTGVTGALSPGDINIRCDSSNQQGNAGGIISITAGDNLNTVEGYAGEVYITAGRGNDAAGAIYLSSRQFSGGQIAILTAGLTAPSGAAALGFFGESPVGRPVVTGSRGGNAALASLLTALAALGLVTNSTTA
jgi:hypothetical protein